MYYSNGVFQGGGLSYAATDRCILKVYNSTGTLIKSGSAVAISSFKQSFTAGKLTKFIIHGVPAVSDEKFWGIAAADIPPELSGSVVVSGIAKAFIGRGTGVFATPGSDGVLMATMSGSARILWRGDELNPGLIVLGAAESPDAYRGPFAVRYVGNRDFEIYDTSYPEGQYCGYTDLPGADKVPRQIFTIPEGMNNCMIYLVACCNDGEYSVVFSHETWGPPESGAFDYTVIGFADVNGRAESRYSGDTTVYFGDYWFL